MNLTVIEPQYSFYMIPKSFIENVTKKYGRNDLFFRDIYNYRNLKKNDIYKEFGLEQPFGMIYSYFSKSVVDDYINLIGNEKFKKCLDDERMNVETIFDNNDSFVDCKDIIDYWNNKSNPLPDTNDLDHHYFERFLMEYVENIETERNEIYYVYRKCEILHLQEM